MQFVATRRREIPISFSLVVLLAMQGCEPCGDPNAATCQAETARDSGSPAPPSPACEADGGSDISTDDDTPDTCVELGTVRHTLTVRNRLGGNPPGSPRCPPGDSSDWASFELEAPATVSIAASGGPFRATLHRADPTYTMIGAWTSSQSGPAAGAVNAGKLLLHATPLPNCCGYEPFDYELVIDVTPFDDLARPLKKDPGDTPSDAATLDAGVVGGSVTVGGFVGLDDASDFYRFTVPADAEANLQVVAPIPRSITVAIFRDATAPTENVGAIGGPEVTTLGPFRSGTYVVGVSVEPSDAGVVPGAVYQITLGLVNPSE